MRPDKTFRKQAKDLVHQAAVDSGRPGLRVVGVRRDSRPLMNWDVHGAVAAVGRATSLRWVDSPDGHDLEVVYGDTVYYMAVARPGGAG
jgi:hypothetical protein